jgi:hypothetical protein
MPARLPLDRVRIRCRQIDRDAGKIATFGGKPAYADFVIGAAGKSCFMRPKFFRSFRIDLRCSDDGTRRLVLGRAGILDS